jgi:hypothetical protein
VEGEEEGRSGAAGRHHERGEDEGATAAARRVVEVVHARRR